MKNIDGALHVRGEAQFVDDATRPSNMAFAAVFGSPVAHGTVSRLYIDKARQAAGVIAILTASDIRGTNEVGPIVQDEPLLAEDEVRYVGHPLAIVVAQSSLQARAASSLITVDIAPLPVFTDPRAAFEAGEIIGATRTFEAGDPDGTWDSCDFIVQGSCDIGGQEHVYLETHRSRAVPLENGRVRVYASTQSPYSAQKHIAKILGVANNQVEVEVQRLGGGFGGKEDQATHWACFAALAAVVTRRPVEIVLRRDEDFLHTGKRHPYKSDFRIGASESGLILAYEVRHFQNAGAAADLSPGILERTLFHSTGSYFVPNARLFAASCRTNLPPNTAFRGFGGPQGMFVIESAIARLAEEMGMERDVIQARNLLAPGDTFPYGQPVQDNRTRRAWSRAVAKTDIAAATGRISAFNRQNGLTKKGLALMPVTFGISFTSTFLNQAGALVHVYTDGSVAVTTGGVEMGQGLTTNIAAIVSRTFGISPDRIRVENTNTTRVANMSPSAASATTLLNGNAAQAAANQIWERLEPVARQELAAEHSDRLHMQNGSVYLEDQKTDLTWESIVLKAYLNRIDLSAHGFFATPDLHYDKTREFGRPFAYHAGGTAVIEVTVDCLRGRYQVDGITVVHDAGRPLSKLVDIGQVEGALAQGLGWMTMEDLRYDSETGRLLSSNLASYKVPDAFFMPDKIDVEFLDNADEVLGPYGGKAIGEPPLMYGIGVFFAIRNAMIAFNPNLKLGFDSPMTPERVLTGLYPEPASGVTELRS